MRVEIVSPEAVVYSGEGDMVVARTTAGEIGIMKDHEPIVGSLRFGELRVYDGAQIGARYAVYGGFIEMRDNVVRVLSDDAENAKDIDAGEAAVQFEAAAAAVNADPDNNELNRVYERAKVRVDVSNAS